MKELLSQLYLQDHPTFMHSLAVTRAARKLFDDLFLLLDKQATTPAQKRQLAQLWHSLQEAMQFVALHDIGKVATSTDPEEALRLVHPLPGGRLAYDKARHWLHPQIGAYFLLTFAETLHGRLRDTVKNWALLTLLHDHNLTPYVMHNVKDFDPSFEQHGKISVENQLVLFIFALCDTSMAMGLPRPNKTAQYSAGEIGQALYRNHLPDAAIALLFEASGVNSVDFNFVRQYILSSIFNTLGELRKSYPETIWTQLQPSQSYAEFYETEGEKGMKRKSGEQKPNSATTSGAIAKEQRLEVATRKTWKKHEKQFEDAMETLQKGGFL